MGEFKEFPIDFALGINKSQLKKFLFYGLIRFHKKETLEKKYLKKKNDFTFSIILLSFIYS